MRRWGACRIGPTNGLVLLRPNGRPIPMTLANWLMRSVSPISAAWLKRLIVTIWLMVRHAPSSRCCLAAGAMRPASNLLIQID